MRPWILACVLVGLLGSTSATAAAQTAADAAIKIPSHVSPGGMVIGSVSPGSAVSIDGRDVRVSENGRFVFGVGRNATGEVGVVITPPDGNTITRKVAVDQREYDIQRIDGLPQRKVEPSKEDQAKIEADWIKLNDAKATDSDLMAFADSAVWPAVGPISGVFGSQRILNGIPKSPHRGVDVAAPEGTPVGTMLDGVVTVAADDMYYTGGTVMVDHGHGIQSLYAHLSTVDVSEGQRLAKGERLGAIGTTGRSTGPHLHFSLYWFKTSLDPALILGPMPSTEAKK